MKRRTLYILLMLGMSLSQSSHASWLSDGKYASEFLTIGIDAKALGMGGAYISQTQGASSVYWNPAGLAHLSSQEVILMHAEQFEGIVGYDYLGYGRPRNEKSGWGFGLVRLGVDDIPITTLTNPNSPLADENRVIVDHYTTDTEMALFAGYGGKYSEMISYGASAKLIGKWVASNSAYGVGFDLGLRIHPWERVYFGAVLQDALTTAIIWDTGQKELVAPTMKLGSAYRLDIPALIARLTFAADLDFRFTDRGTADQFQFGQITADSHVGMEYLIDISGTSLALRAGAEPSREQDEEGFLGNYTFGAGILFPNLNIDYAFLAHPELGDTHRVSLSILWGRRAPKPPADVNED